MLESDCLELFSPEKREDNHVQLVYMRKVKEYVVISITKTDI